MLMYLGLGVLLLVLVVLMRILRNTGDGTGNWTFKVNTVPRVVTASLDSLGVPTKIVFNGQEYSSPDEMPPDARAAYNLAMSMVKTNAHHDSDPDVFKSVGRPGGFSARIGAGAGASGDPGDPATRLKHLQSMRDAGLITDAEYEAKRSEIIDSV